MALMTQRPVVSRLVGGSDPIQVPTATRPSNLKVEPKLDYLTPHEKDKVTTSLDPRTGDRLIDKLEFLLIGQPHSRVMAAGLKLFVFQFPDRNEREPLYLIRDRITELQDPTKKQAKYGDHNFHAVVVRHTETGEVIGYCQWSYLAAEGSNAVYSQYQTVEPAFRALGVSTLMTALRFTVSEADARSAGLDMGLGGATSEAEFAGQGLDKFTFTRLDIHTRQGKSAFVLQMPDGKQMPVWIQPPLSETSDPFMLNLLWRPADPGLIDVTKPVEVDKSALTRVLSGLMFNFRTEGFHEIVPGTSKMQVYLSHLPPDVRQRVSNGVELSHELMLDRIGRASAVLLVPAINTKLLTTYADCDPILRMQVEREARGAGFSLADYAKQVRSLASI